MLPMWPVKGRENGHLRMWPVKGRENGHLTEVVTLIVGEKSCQRVRGGQFNGENGPVTEVATLMEGE